VRVQVRTGAPEGEYRCDSPAIFSARTGSLRLREVYNNGEWLLITSPMRILPRFLRGLRYRAFYALLINRKFKLVTLGDQSYGLQWTICPTGLGPESVVYSGGVGEDISFEHELVGQFGCNILLLDPSPTGLKTMERPENQVPQFRFFPMALAARSGKLTLAPPQDGLSWFAREDAEATLEVPCWDLQSIMRQQRHTRIDLLKLDIEGCEYEVINAFLEQRIPIRQICVEFHHGVLPNIRRSQTVRSILKLRARGYKLLCQEGGNHTFISGTPG
jgi:FkbM family methyltransferase